MKHKPDYRLQAREGVPVCKLLLAQRQLDPPQAWTALEYAITIILLLMITGGWLYVANLVVDVLWGAK